MGNLVAGQIHNSFQALLEGNVMIANQIIVADKQVDKLDLKIDKLCQRIFALTQPVATDLRLIMSALRINNDLERMGDHAVGIAMKIEQVSSQREILTLLKMDELIKMTDLVVNDVINILNSRNTAFVPDIFHLAAEIDDRIQISLSLIIDEMMHKTEAILLAEPLIKILGAIERIAAYSTNIAESVVFIADGKMIKHKKKYRGDGRE